MQKTKRACRTKQQWQEIIDRFSESELSAPKFCTEQNISYASFMKWKQSLLGTGKRTAKKKLPEFVELTPPTAPSSQWAIELDLAPGIQLRIARNV